MGDSLVLNSNNYTIGTHEINLSVSNECGEEITTSNLIIEKCEIPNVITPNGDGQNDFFYTHFAAIYDDVHLTVLNRWGVVIMNLLVTKMIGTVLILKENHYLREHITFF